MKLANRLPGALIVMICTTFALPAQGRGQALPNPDRPASTPVVRTAGAAASASQRCRRMREELERGASQTGLFVADTGSGKVLCRKSSNTRRPLASNMKLFTTATALARFGAEERIATRVFGLRRPGSDGILRGGIYLKGGGDPALGSPAFYDTYLGGLGTNLFALVSQLRAKGIRRVSGRLFADDTVFDRRRGVADSGYATSPYIGPLSGLAFNSGFSDSSARRFASDPARVAATKLARSLRNRGVTIRTRVAMRETPADARLLAVVRSPRIVSLANATNVYSNNFFAEMLLKNLGAHYGSGGSTGAGATVVERFARAHGSGVHAVDGSGLTRTNRASPAQVGRLLQAMRAHRAGADFVRSLAVAGREGTVAERMRGTAAAGRCRTKTGTLIGVSALSGYCFARSGRVIVFSILMSGVGNLHRAHVAQDRIAALAAGY